jgi:hypothetical protein
VLFGDKDRLVDESTLLATYGAPGSSPTATSWSPPLTTPAMADAPMPTMPRITRLVLSKAAKRIIVLFIVLGVVFQVGSAALNLGAVGERVRTVQRLDEDQMVLHDASVEFGAASTSCAVAGGLQCLKAAIVTFRVAMVDYREELSFTDLPAQVLPYAEDLDATAAAIVKSLDRLVGLSDVSAFQAELVHFQTLANEFDASYQSLRNAVLGRT